jgi:hypothetical protein
LQFCCSLTFCCKCADRCDKDLWVRQDEGERGVDGSSHASRGNCI